MTHVASHRARSRFCRFGLLSYSFSFQVVHGLPDDLCCLLLLFFFFFQAEDGIRDDLVTGVQTCALPIFFTLPIGFIETLISNERVVTINATQQATTVTTRDRANGKVKTETFYGTSPQIGRASCRERV